MKTNHAKRRGTVAVLTAIALTILMMVLAMTLDGGVLFSEKRRGQAAADAAALAGAANLYSAYPKNQGVDVGGSASASALTIAAANGYNNDGATSTVVTRTNGQTYLSGPNAGRPIPAGYIEVNVTYHQPRYFSLVMGSGTIPVKARAVAAGIWNLPKWGMLLLEPKSTGLIDQGNAIVDVGTGVIQVNSDGSLAAPYSHLGNALVKGKAVNFYPPAGFDVTGIVTSPIAGNILYGVAPSPDPLASLPDPPATALMSKPKAVKATDSSVKTIIANLVAGGQITQTLVNNLGNQKVVYLIPPGRYNNLPTFNPGELVIFQSGTYYLDSSGFKSTGASILLDPATPGGMMFYNNGTTTSDKISITGNASGVVNISGLTTGPYQGMIVFQKRTATEPIAVSGGGSFNMKGTFYAANANLALSGSGGAYTIGSAVITRSLTVTGNGSITVAFTEGKIQPLRILRLVE